MQSLRELAVLLELVAVELGPLLHKPSGARGQLAVQRIARRDSDTRSVFRVTRMEERRVVIVEEHRYHDAIEGADRRQELEPKVASGQSFDQLAQYAVFSNTCNRVRYRLLRSAIARRATFVDLDEVDLVAASAYPVGSMTRAAEIRIRFFGFLAPRIFAR